MLLLRAGGHPQRTIEPAAARHHSDQIRKSASKSQRIRCRQRVHSVGMHAKQNDSPGPATKRPRLEASESFTLLELLVVMVIIGLPASFMAPEYFSQIGTSEVKATRAELVAVGTMLATYRIDTGHQPDTEGIERPDSNAGGGLPTCAHLSAYGKRKTRCEPGRRRLLMDCAGLAPPSTMRSNGCATGGRGHVSANRNAEAYAQRGVRVPADPPADFAGPLAGLRAARTPWFAVVPFEAPWLPIDLVARLAWDRGRRGHARRGRRARLRSGRTPPGACLLPARDRPRG
jgi:prepilin-type N-terminal cleavage/methylation domain-containing protein